LRHYKISQPNRDLKRSLPTTFRQLQILAVKPRVPSLCSDCRVARQHCLNAWRVCSLSMALQVQMKVARPEVHKFDDSSHTQQCSSSDGLRRTRPNRTALLNLAAPGSPSANTRLKYALVMSDCQRNARRRLSGD
jgi:hypothetical protein